MADPGQNPDYSTDFIPPSYETSIEEAPSAPIDDERPPVDQSQHSNAPPQVVTRTVFVPQPAPPQKFIVTERTPLIINEEVTQRRGPGCCAICSCCGFSISAALAFLCIVLICFMFCLGIFIILFAIASYLGNQYSQPKICPSRTYFTEQVHSNDGPCCKIYDETCCTVRACDMKSNYSSILTGGVCDGILNSELACASCNPDVNSFGLSIKITDERVEDISICTGYCKHLYGLCKDSTIIDPGSIYYLQKVSDAYSEYQQIEFCQLFLGVSVYNTRCLYAFTYVDGDIATALNG